MKRSLALAGGAIAAIVAAGSPLHAQGSGVDQHSACMVGRVGAGVASPCADASALYFSPAGLAFTPSAIGIGAAITAVSPNAKAGQVVGMVVFFPGMFTAGVYFPVEVFGRKGAVGEADPNGLDPAQRISREHHLHGRSHAAQPGMKLIVGRAHRAHRRIADLGVFSHVDQVAGGRQFGPSGEAPAVHLRNHGLGQVPNAKRAFDHVPRPMTWARSGGKRRRQAARFARQVVTGRKAGPGPANDHDPHLGVRVRRLQLPKNLTAKRVR